MTLITVYALFFDDIRMIAFPKEKDDIFYGITLFGICAFAIELIAAMCSIDDYNFSFFFWLDLVSTLSMVPDCGWIWDPLTGGGGNSATDLAKTSRASKITRVIRVIRLIRLIRIVKLYKQAKLAQKKAQELKLRMPVKAKNVKDENEEEDEELPEVPDIPLNIGPNNGSKVLPVD